MLLLQSAAGFPWSNDRAQQFKRAFLSHTTLDFG